MPIRQKEDEEKDEFGGVAISTTKKVSTTDSFGGVPIGGELGVVGGALEGVNISLADVFGAPVDIANFATNFVREGFGMQQIEEPVGGSASIQSLFEATGSLSGKDFEELGPEAKLGFKFGRPFGGAVATALPIFGQLGRGAAFARGVGATGAAATPGTAAFKALTKTGPGQGGTLRQAGRGIVDTAARNPLSFAAVETGAGLGAGQGAVLAELAAPGDEAVALAAEIAGGVLNPTGITFQMLRGLGRKGVSIGSQFTKGGRKREAGELLSKWLIDAGEDPETVKRLLLAPDVDGATLTAGLKTGSPALLALEKKLAADNADFSSFSATRVKETFEILRGKIDGLLATGDPDALRIAGKMRQRYFEDLLSSRITKARGDAAEAVAKISTTGTKKEVSAAAHDAIAESLREARAVENSLWNAIPKKVPVQDVSDFRTTVDRMTSRLIEDETLPFPKTVAKILSDEVTTAGDLLNFRSRLLDSARDLRAQKQFSKAKLHSELAESLIADLSKLDIPIVDPARQYSRLMNDAFSRTFAGKALETSGSGAQRIAPELLLERAFGVGGTKGDIQMQELQNAAKFGDRARGMNAQFAGEPMPLGEALGADVSNAQERFLAMMAQRTLDNGVVNPTKLTKFLDENAELLGRFPELRDDLANAGKATQMLSRTQEGAKRASKAIASKAAFSKLVGFENPSQAIERIMTGQSPRFNMNQLAKLARGSGPAAVEGARVAVMDWAILRARGPEGLDFKKLQEVLFTPLSRTQGSPMKIIRENRIMPRAAFEPFERIIKRGIEIQEALKTGVGADEIIGSPDAISDLIVRIGGARIGAAAGGSTVGAPLIAAGAGSKAARNLFEKVPNTRLTDVFIEAAKDPKFAATLLGQGKKQPTKVELQKQINGFLIQAGIIDKSEDN